jgi:transposase
MPNPENCSLAELTTAAKAAPTWRSANRLMAIKALLMGFDRQQVAGLHEIDERCLSNWIKAFNRSGIDGLIEKPRSGRPRKINPEQSEQYRELIEQPRNAEQDHWTARKFHGYLRDELRHEVGYSTVVRWLHEQNFRLKVPRPWPNHQDEEARRLFVERLGDLLADDEIDLWYQDESGIEGDPRPRRRWIEVGKSGRLPYEGRHLRFNVCGMIRPRTGDFFALEFSHNDSDTFQIFLDHANRDLKFDRPRNILILDNASWHKRKSTRWGRFEPLYLPPYSPDLNPIERLWQLIKAEWFADWIAKDINELLDRIDKALRWAMNRQAGNQRTCSIGTNF